MLRGSFEVNAQRILCPAGTIRVPMAHAADQRAVIAIRMVCSALKQMMLMVSD